LGPVGRPIALIAEISPSACRGGSYYISYYREGSGIIEQRLQVIANSWRALQDSNLRPPGS